jgi:CubicO group peptidase (beta-lactamase class C family)
MKKHRLFASVLVVVVAAACRPAPVKEKPYDGVIADLADLIEAETTRLDIPCLSIALVDDQEIVWQAGFGVQDGKRGVPASENTVYRVGSISKVVTAAAVAQLAEQGGLDLDAPITRYLPELVFEDPFSSSEEITLRHLHAHRAGILRESPKGNYFDTSEPTIEETVQSIIGTRLIHPVGSTTKYSNLGPTVGGLVLERVSGMPFVEYVQQHILDPAGMTSSSFLRDREVIRQNLADAFMIGFDGSFFPAQVFEMGPLPAGNLYSTVGDLARFIMMFFNDGVAGESRMLAPETVQQMFTPQFPDDEGGLQFGIGFAIGELEGHKTVWHNGGIYGYSSQMIALPEEKLAVVVLNDVDTAFGLDDKIASQALRLMLNAKMDAGLELLPATVERPGLNPAEYTGKYLSERWPAFVAVEGGVLELQLDGITRVIRPLADGSFISDDRKVYGGAVVFLRDEDGHIIGFEANGREYTRVGAYEPDPSVPARWRALIGDYGWPHNVMRISVLDGELWCQVEWFFFYPMTQVSQDVFAFPDYGFYSNEELHFRHDAGGAVVGADMATVFFPRIGDR